ncbi:MAG: SCO family protein [Lentisphaerae bacterium]|nr:SCO family protein [Lentisphaerota bacterium]
MKTSGTWPLRLGILLVAAGAGAAIALFVTLRREPAPVALEDLPKLEPVAAFTLTDASGAAIGLEQFKGKLWTANLFFASCTSICPPLTRNLAKLQVAVGAGVDFDLLSVSVDPEHDTPGVLAAFAAQYQADTNRWHFATAARETVQALAVESLHLGAQGEPVNHSPYVVLVDRDGIIRGYYDGLEAEAMARLAADLKRLAN